MDFKIDDSVPMPMNKQDILDTYPIAALEPGQSFFTPADTKLGDKITKVARTFGSEQEPERTFVVERRTENDQAGLRVWRKT